MPLRERRRYSFVTALQSAFRPRAAPAAAKALLMPRCQSRIVPPVSKVSAFTAMAGADITASDKISVEENTNDPLVRTHFCSDARCRHARDGTGLAGQAGVVRGAVPA